MKQTWKLDSAQRARLPTLYRSGASICQLAETFGVSPQAVYQFLRREGTPIRTLSVSHTRYRCNHAFFQVVNTEATAYWLGFLAADGHISPRKRSVDVLTLTLSTHDQTHLDHFKQAISAEHPVRVYITKKGFGYCRLAIASQELVDDLATLGIGPLKRHRLSFPTVPSHLIHHFMRGYFDGDGSISDPLTRLGWKNPRVSVIGYHSFISEYQARLASSCGLDLLKLSWRLGTPYFAYGGRLQVLRIFTFLYRDATVYLDRKYQRFLAYARLVVPAGEASV